MKNKHEVQKGMLSHFRKYASDRMGQELKGDDGPRLNPDEMPDAKDPGDMGETFEASPDMGADDVPPAEAGAVPSDLETHLVDPSLLTPADIEFLREILKNAEPVEAKHQHTLGE